MPIIHGRRYGYSPQHVCRPKYPVFRPGDGPEHGCRTKLGVFRPDDGLEWNPAWASLVSQEILLFLSIDNTDMNHKRIYAIFTAILLACTAVSSCITLTVASVATSAVYALAKSNTRIKGNTTRQINDNAAVLITNKGEEVCIVYSFDGNYKNGMRINAKFRLGGIYEYSDSVGDKHRIPIYVYSKEIEKLAQTAMELDIRYQKQNDGATYQI